MKETNHIIQYESWNNFILDGDMDSLSKVYYQYYDCLFDYGHKHTSDKQLIENAIQDVFINIVKFRKSISEVKNLTGYLISSFRRQLLVDIEKQKKTILTDQVPEEYFDYFKSPEQDILETENIERLHSTIKHCMSKLTDRQREIIFLRFEREISYEEIAKILNISVESCYKSSYRSIRIIRSEVEKIMGKVGDFILCLLFKSTLREK